MAEMINAGGAVGYHKRPEVLARKLWHQKNRLLDPKEKEKDAVRAYTRKKIKEGIIIKSSTCEKCGSEKNIHGHHDDYSRPLDIRWLCQSCHFSFHKGAQGKREFCFRGHRFTELTTRLKVRPNGKSRRQCKICKSEYDKAWIERNKKKALEYNSGVTK